MKDRVVTPEMVPTIKRAIEERYNYARIAAYFGGINIGRISDVKYGRIGRGIPAAATLPPDFPTA